MNEEEVRIINEKAEELAEEYVMDFPEEATFRACVEIEILRARLAKVELERDELKMRLP